MRIILLAAVLIVPLYLFAQPLSEEMNGPCAMGTFTLSPAGEGYDLTFSDLKMPFVVVPGPEGEGWIFSRPGGSIAAHYALVEGQIRLLSGMDGQTEKVWLLDQAEVAKQQATTLKPNLLLGRATDFYADLLLASMQRGLQPLFTMNLLQDDLPGHFQLLGLPAYDPRAAEMALSLRRADIRKQEGNMASGTFALVSPSMGMTMACASGWVALASAAWSDAEAYYYDGPLPYNHKALQAWDAVSLPSYWQELQVQNAGEGGMNHIYTTVLLPGLALIATQSADSSSLMGMTLLYQPYMQGLAPPSLLPPYGEDSLWRTHFMALQRNAYFDWALLSASGGANSLLNIPGMTPVDTSLFTPNATIVERSRGYRTQYCPGSESPLQGLCASRLVEECLALLGPDYETKAIRRDESLESIQQNGAVYSSAWLLVHREDAGKAAVDRQHPVWAFLFGPDPQADASKRSGSFDRGFYLEAWVYPPTDLP